MSADGVHASDSSVPELSVVLPLFNEEETIPELERRLPPVLSSLGVPYEIVVVNDGSSDASLDLLRRATSRIPQMRVVDLSRNFGHQAALLAGLAHARGRAIVMMDADLQDPPEEIPRMLERWRGGAHVVYAVRHKRKEGLLKRAAYGLYYRLLKAVSFVPIPVDSGDFGLVDRRVVDLILSLPEKKKFLRGLRAWAGFRQERHDYERAPRFAGEPKYTLVKLMRLALDGLLAYSYVPLRAAYVVGLVVSAGAFVLAGVYVFQRLFTSVEMPRGFTTLAVLNLFLGGVQLIFMGVIGEYIGRIYEEVKGRPTYVVREVIAGTAMERASADTAVAEGAIARVG